MINKKLFILYIYISVKMKKQIQKIKKNEKKKELVKAKLIFGEKYRLLTLISEVGFIKIYYFDLLFLYFPFLRKDIQRAYYSYL